MKKPSSKFLSTLLGGVFLCVIFSACDNFMRAGDIRKEVETAIEYNNALSCTVNFSSLDTENNDLGSFLTGPQQSIKIGYSKEIQFKVNTSDYIFETLQAVNINDEKLLPDGYITFTIEESSDESTGLYRISVHLLQKNDNILIRPVCKLRPKVLSVSPAFESSGCDQDTMIKINFNKEMNLENFGDFSCISIYSETELWDYFDTPFLSNDKKTLCIQPKQGMHIISPDDTSTPVIHVRYDFTGIKDNDNLFLSQKDTHDYRINSKYNGQKKVEVKLEADEKFGKFITGSTRSCTVGYGMEVQFKVNLKDYKFKTLEAVSQKNPLRSYSDAVSTFDLLEKDEDKGIYTLSFRVIQEPNDKTDVIVIRPVCLEYPAVLDYTPKGSQSYPSNTRITIQFNMAMEDSITEKIQFSIGNSDAQEFIESSVLDSEKRVLTITPDQSAIKNFLIEEKKAAVTIKITLPDSITVNREGLDFPLKQDTNTVFSVTYVTYTETVPPEALNFFVTRDSITPNTNLSNINSFNTDIILMDEAYAQKYASLQSLWYEYIIPFINQQEQIIENRMGKSIYLYGQFKDEGSGIEKITVYEQFKGDDPEHVIENSAPVTTDYFAKSPGVVQFRTDSNGITTFCINHQLKSNDGAVSLKVIATDVCGNSAESTSVLGFKRTVTVFDNIENFTLNNSIPTNNITEENFSKQIKKLTLEVQLDQETSNGDSIFADLLYGFCLPPEINIITCEYINKQGRVVTQDFKKAGTDDTNWIYELELDVEQVNGLALKFVFADDTGNKTEREYSIPPLDDFTYIVTQFPWEYNGNTNYDTLVNFFYTSGKETGPRRFIIIDEYGNKATGDYDDYYGLWPQSNTYIPIPCYAPEKVNGNSVVFFYSETPENVLLKKQDGPDFGEAFPLENYENSEYPYKLITKTTPDRTNISVKIPQFLWEKNCSSGYVLIKDKGLLPPRDGYSEPDTGNKYIFFDKNASEALIEVRTQDLYASNTELVVYGISQDIKYEKSIIIPQLTPAQKEYDNNLPDFTKRQTGPESFLFTISDTESGPKVGKFYAGADIFEELNQNINVINYYYPNREVLTAEQYNNYEITIPAWHYYDIGISYYINDQQNNYYAGNIKPIMPAINWTVTSIQKTNDNKLKVYNQKKTNSTGKQRNHIYIYTYNKNNNTWGSTPKKVELMNQNEYEFYQTTGYQPNNQGFVNISGYESTTNPVITLQNTDSITEFPTQDCFIKIITVAEQSLYLDENNKPVYEEYDVSCPFIAYLGCSAFAVSSTAYDSSSDLVLPNGSSTDSVAISSKSPVLVQTAVTWQPYEVCKNWKTEDWLNYKHIVGNEQLDLNNTTSLKRYKIPVSYIYEGQCYCVIAHFADGHTEKSQVMQK